MFSVAQKRAISDAVQKILRETNHPELPDGEIQFLLHVDGAESWSWADIRNNGAVTNPDVNPWNELQDKGKMPTEARIVNSKPGTIFHIYGWEKFRCRIETKERGFFKKKIMFRAIIEAYGYSKFQPSKSWNENFQKLDWVSDKSLAILHGNNYLTVLESMEPEEEFKEGEYI